LISCENIHTMNRRCDDDDDDNEDNDIPFPNPANALASLSAVTAMAAVMAKQ